MMQRHAREADEGPAFRNLFEAVPDALLIADDNRRYIDANPAACELLGLTREALVGTRIEDYADPSLRSILEEQWLSFLRVGTQDGEYVLRRPDGQTRVVEFRARAHIVRHRHLSVLRDVTERRRMDRMLEDRGLLKAVIDHSPVGIAVHRGPDLLCELVNPALKTMLPARTLVGRNAREVFGATEDVVNAIASTMGGWGPQRCCDVRLGSAERAGGPVAPDTDDRARASAEPTHVSTSSVALRDSRGRIDRVLTMFVDTTADFMRRQLLERHAADRERLLEQVRTELTDRLRTEVELRRTEERLREAQKLDALGRVAAGVAHDVNNVLSVILSCVDLALCGIHRSTSIERELLDIQLAGQRGADLTRQLLAFCRRQPMSPQPTALGHVLREIEPLLRRLLPAAVQLRIEGPPELPLVLVDPTQIQQVVANLVTNARDAMPRGGEVLLRTANVVFEEPSPEVPTAPPGHYVELAVEDTGEGMTDDVRARMFEPFFTTKGQGHGAGLGLAVVFGVVTQSKGHIRVDSEPGRGTRISLYFPVYESLPAEVDAKPESTPTGGTETILLVEDEDAVRAVAARVLRGLGYSVMEAPSGDEALKILEAKAPQVHLVVSDVVMPGIDGRELSVFVHKNWPHIKVLLMSGYTELVASFAEAECPDYVFVQKPFTPALLASKVRQALQLPGP